MRRFLLAASLPAIATLLAFGLARGARKDTIRARHALHAENEVTCDVCHEAAATSRAGADDLLPTHAVCEACHDVTSTETCGQCHADLEHPLASARRTVVAQKFSHEAHVARGMECAACHAIDAAGETRLPAMSSCRACHATASDRTDCAICHASSEPLRPASHVPGWVSFHGLEARGDAATCENCHTQTDCQECHAGDDVRPRVHPLNFAFGHALAARGNELSCATCHEDRDFCASCHVAERVIPQDHSRADWVSTAGGRHAEEGALDIEACMGCHDSGADAPTCAPCHGR